MTPEEAIAEIQKIMTPEWLHGRVLQAYVGAESAARMAAIKQVLEKLK